MSAYGRMPNFDTHGFTWPGGPEYSPPPPPRCERCGGFLRWVPDRQEPWEDTLECDGSATEEKVEREGAMLDILGPGVDTYQWSPCGSMGGVHAPHMEVVDAGVTLVTTCRHCGHVNRDG